MIALLSTLSLIALGRRPELRLLRLAGRGAANCGGCCGWRRRRWP
ncbi:hypothetical protein O1L68_19310 [Streptomyces lydicus]|nr:hypothetical protein [Streptomyces lydicus]